MAEEKFKILLKLKRDYAGTLICERWLGDHKLSNVRHNSPEYLLKLATMQLATGPVTDKPMELVLKWTISFQREEWGADTEVTGINETGEA